MFQQANVFSTLDIMPKIGNNVSDVWIGGSTAVALILVKSGVGMPAPDRGAEYCDESVCDSVH